LVKESSSGSLQESTGAGQDTASPDAGDDPKKSSQVRLQKRSKGKNGGNDKKESQKGREGENELVGKSIPRRGRTRKGGGGERDDIDKEVGVGLLTHRGQKRPRSDSQSGDIYDRKIRLIDGRHGIFKRDK
jgi:hypothetical protein